MYYGAHRHLHSFPTRRSSDLFKWEQEEQKASANASRIAVRIVAEAYTLTPRSPLPSAHPDHRERGGRPRQPRSEEHTSELQSQSNLVCRLLLEKKNKEKAFNT